MREGTLAALLGALQTLAIAGAFAGGGLAIHALGAFSPARAEVAYPAGDVGDLWLVDGFNVIQVALLAGSDRSGWWRRERRAELLARADRLGDPAAEVWVVFDGPSPPAEPEAGRARRVFAPSADRWLLERLREAPDPARVRVVTADRRLAERARRRGALVVAPRAFLDLCAPGRAASAQPPATPDASG